MMITQYLAALKSRFSVSTSRSCAPTGSIPPAKQDRHALERWKVAVLQFALLVAAFSLLRIVLAVAFPPAVTVGQSEYLRAFLVGLHFDITASALLTLPLALLCSLAPENWWRSKLGRRVLIAGLALGWSLIIFLLVAEGYFFQEFQSRFNPVAVDYLLYPHEVFINVWESYPVLWVVMACGIAALLVASVSASVTRTATRSTYGHSTRLGFGVLWVAGALLLAFTLDLDDARFSRDRNINELANNTFVALGTAVWTRNLDYAHFYPTMSREEAFARVHKLLTTSDAKFVSDPFSVERHIDGVEIDPKLNLVLLLEESLGSEFFGSLGRIEPSLMPRMDALATNEALLFENIYADGNRTIRGYEGVFSSFPPLPGDSIVARDHSENVETIARVLERQGYDTTFIYAGRGVFDGTRHFATANGWKNFIELKDFENPVFESIWGVCNEDLYDRLIVECRDRNAKGVPFFMTTMSVSNHKPFSFPAGRIPDDPKAHSRKNAVKYTDYALGRFFEKVKKEPFWTNTVFVVVGDHGARVYGSQTIPIRSYEVPMIVLGPAAVREPKRISTLGCQLDVAPTLLGLLKRPYESCFFGHDLLNHPEAPTRCLLHHNRSIGIYNDQRLVVFSLNKKVEYFTGDPKKGQMTRTNHPDKLMKELESDAVALFQTADELYMSGRFRVGASSSGAEHDRPAAIR